MKFFVVLLSIFLSGISFADEEPAKDSSVSTAGPHSAGPKNEMKRTEENNSDLVYSRLAPEDKWIYDRGEIGSTAYILGGILGTYPFGLGIGHAIQGRYRQKGWIFTVGEIGATSLMLTGLLDCGFGSIGSSRRDNCSMNFLMTAGALGYLGFRIWEIIDLWAYPPEHNDRYLSIRSRLGRSSKTMFLKPSLALNNDGILLLGAELRF